MPKYSVVKIYTDGGARGNPGSAAIGIVVCDQNDGVIKSFSEFIGWATNNQAEYRALIRGMEIAANYTDSELDCILDSELVVRQMTGEYRIKNEEMRKLAEIALEKSKRFRKVLYTNRPRMTGHLAEADRLVNETLDNMRRPSQPPVDPGITKEVEIGVRRNGGHEDKTPEEHKALLSETGISEQEDREWHKAHGLSEEDTRGRRTVDPFEVGGAFLEFCVMQGWLIKEGKGRTAKYFVTDEGEKELRVFGIDASH